MVRIITFQDFEKAKATGKSVAGFVAEAISEHINSDACKIARDADLYDKQRNVTINEYVRTMFTIAGAPVEDYTASNNKIASNFFHRLNTQRCTYSLGNGVAFANDESGKLKKKLGFDFDNAVFDAGYKALIHGVSFGFWNLDRLHIFPLTEFKPLWDEYDGTLKAGIRYWRIDKSKPITAVLYELDGFTKFRSQITDGVATGNFEEFEPKRGYNRVVRSSKDGGSEVIGEENYSALPIVPLWGSKLKQSTLVGMQTSIDSFDLIRSGFANDLTDCAEIYWLIENSGGMLEEDLARFRDRLKLNHIVEVNTGSGAKASPYTQDIPYAARQAYLNDMRAGIYEDFGGLDVHAVSADSTNDHLEAAYQPMDENADDFEYQVIAFVRQILKVAGFEDDMPVFKRNRISNTREQVDIVMAEAEYLDEQTVLSKLPNITPDEIAEIMQRKDNEDRSRMASNPFLRDEEPESEQ